MTSATYPPLHRTFGKRVTPPLSAEQRAHAAALLRDAERQAAMTRMMAYHGAHWEQSMANAWASLREAEGDIAQRRLGAMGGRVVQVLMGFALGVRLGR